MTKEALDNLVLNESFNKAIENAVPHRIKIMTDLTGQMKELQKVFNDLMVEADYNGVQDLQKNKKTSDDAKVDLYAWKKNMSQTFQRVKHVVHPNQKKDGERCDPIQGIVDHVVQIAQVLKYIGNTELEDKFAAAGITIGIKPLEQVAPFFAKPDAKARMIQIWNDVDNVQGQICTNADEIKITQFESLDEELKFSKENKKGLRPAEFQKIVRNTAIGKIKDSDKFTKYMEKVRADNVATIEREQIMLEKNKQI